MLHTHLAALALAAIVFAVSGCGSSGGSGSSSSKSDAALTKAELNAKGDAICERIFVRLHATPYRTSQAIGRLAPGLAAYEQTQVAEMRKLVPPPSMASDWSEIVENSQIIANDTAKLGEDAEHNDFKAATPLFTASRATQTKVQPIAERDGFKRCGQDG
jgi:hypothetical protein